MQAQNDRAANADTVLGRIPVLRAVPLFQEFISGGGPWRDISASFAVDFTNAQATIDTTMFLVDSLADFLKANPPAFPPGANTITVNINVLDQGTMNQVLASLAFRNPFEVPGLIAGGRSEPGSEKCLVGAQPSGQVDARFAEGTVTVTRNTDGTLVISPDNITYRADDTLDFCPGNCGSSLAQTLTVPLSRWEASGISGDIPFTVRFSAQPTGAFNSEP